jgi:hypothetical protein
VTRLDDLTADFLALADTMQPRAPFAASVCRAIADHPGLVELLLAAPPEQQDPVLLLAALHDHVLGAPDSELAQWYPTVTSTPRTDDVRGAVERHCRRHADHLRRTVSTHNTQTNEVGRCAFFLPALALLAAETGPVSLIDIGTSGALNLRLDRYEYHYLPGGAVGGPSPVRFDTGTRGPVPVPRRLPSIGGRIGLDQHPIDVTDPLAARWLTACVWPDQTDRFERLRAAISIAHDHPVDLRRGDAVDDLAEAVSSGRRTGHPVVLNSWVLNYLSDERRAAYLAELERLGRHDDLSWVFAESPARTIGLPFPDPLAGEHITALMMVRWRNGERDVRHLGTTHPHGYWLHWAA